jgi:hypothetical protein
MQEDNQKALTKRIVTNLKLKLRADEVNHLSFSSISLSLSRNTFFYFCF